MWIHPRSGASMEFSGRSDRKAWVDQTIRRTDQCAGLIDVLGRPGGMTVAIELQSGPIDGGTIEGCAFAAAERTMEDDRSGVLRG